MFGLLSALDAPWVLLAQDKQPGAPMDPCGGMWPAFIAIPILMYFFFMRPQQRERQQRQEMLKAIKKNDRVVTIGGIVGVVANVTPEGNEVTLKIDESTGTKIRVLRSSIHEVLKDDKEATEPPKPSQ